MLDADPDLLVHLGDRIYSDNVLEETVDLPDGSRWRNIVTPAKAKVAETLDEYRGNYRYNLLDEHVRRFHAAVPQLVTWDDHEVANDWWPDATISRLRARRRGYGERSMDTLAARGRKAFFEYTPVGHEAASAGRIWRSVACGPLAEVFLLDSRSHRGPNRLKDRVRMADDAVLLGRAQVDWLKKALARSSAQWKIIGNPLPITHYNKRDADRGYFDKYADGEPGMPSGREREIADILSFIKAHGIRNVVWITADVHYAAAHRFHPDRAGARDFTPFWEFVAGPFHTRAYRPGPIDPTFGAERLYASTTGVTGNPPPSAGWCNFGHLHIDGKSGALTVSFRDVNGATMWKRTVESER
jgi:alkaline phosphatase D